MLQVPFQVVDVLVDHLAERYCACFAMDPNPLERCIGKLTEHGSPHLSIRIEYLASFERIQVVGTRQ